MKRNKRNKNGLVGKVSEISNIPFDMALTLPLVKMYTNREIIIEDAGKLVALSNKCIKVKQGKNIISICGESLKPVFLLNGDLKVLGYINSVCFE